jgi:hypothetical protein
MVSYIVQKNLTQTQNSDRLNGTVLLDAKTQVLAHLPPTEPPFIKTAHRFQGKLGVKQL